MFKSKFRLLLILLLLCLLVPYVPRYIAEVHAAPVFQSGFETGSFNEWDGVKKSPSNSTAVVNGVNPYHGSYAAQFFWGNISSDNYVYKVYSGQMTFYSRGYFYLSALPTPGKQVALIGAFGASTLHQFLSEVKVTGALDGTARWAVFYRANGGFYEISSYAATTPRINTWYSVELMQTQGNGTGETSVWIDGASVYSEIGLRNNDTESQVGKTGVGAGDCTYAVWVTADDVVVSPSYIGLSPAPSLTVSVSGGGSTNATGVHLYDAFTNVTVLATPASGWMLDHWTLNGSNVGSVNPYTLNMTADYTLTAVFMRIQYALTVEVSGFGVTNATGMTVHDAFTNVSVLATPASGSFFDHWMLNDFDVGSVNPFTVNMTGDFELTAVFFTYKRTLTVTVTGNGSTNATGTFVYDLYSNVSVLATPDLGYRFDYWILNSSNVGSANPYTLNMTTNFDLVAVFTPIKYSYLVVRGENDQILYRSFDGTSWGDWITLPGSTPRAPAAAIFQNRLYIVVIGSLNNAIFWCSMNLTTSEISGWYWMPGLSDSPPALAASPDRLYLVVRGLDDKIYYENYDGSTWSGWEVLPGSTSQGPAAAVFQGRLHIVVVGTGGYNMLYWGSLNLTTPETFVWNWMPGTSDSPPALAASPDRLYLTVRGTDDKIYYQSYDGSTWTNWAVIYATASDGPGVTILNNKLHMAIRGITGDELWQGSVDPGTGDFSGWTQVPGSTLSSPRFAS